MHEPNPLCLALKLTILWPLTPSTHVFYIHYLTAFSMPAVPSFAHLCVEYFKLQFKWDLSPNDPSVSLAHPQQDVIFTFFELA